MKKQFIIVIAGVVIVGILAALLVLGRKPDGAHLGAQKGYIKEADMAFLNGDLLQARKLYEQAREKVDDTAGLKEIQKKIEDINIKVLFSPIMDKCAKKYTVKPNDSLAKIAKENNTTIELIKRANNITSDIIRPDQGLKVNTCKFSIVVDKSQNILFLKVGNEIVKTYVVSTGKNNSTPVGVFKIINKQPNPTWFRAGAVVPPDSPENILGTRWLGFELKGYGIHGTTMPEDLGKQVTLGCVRMRNDEVEELYDIVPVGTEVTIVD
ncbi:MAG: L,D-transpeptidase family protein [Candidatus Omnitrophica bacterium]|nr:L,D-transpeptidase family protein [Candidatus Omnitrophota bacterium]